ncbi:MAG: hypothetical protein R3344_14010, partial [Acidobacteriota bacterium]|nr:hypothetical protein [Acidobacteriota bacterium]
MSVLGVNLTLNATASDIEDGSLSASIAWSSNVDGSLGTGGSLNVMLSEGTHTITASVSDSNGQSVSAQVTHQVVNNASPTVTITAPADASTLVGIFAIELTGTASDPEDGDLSSSITWSSSIDGALGTGGTINAPLSSGTHTITATVEDMFGFTETDDVSIDVEIPATYVSTGNASARAVLYRVEMGVGGSDTEIGPLQTGSGTKTVLTDIAESPAGALFGN